MHMQPTTDDSADVEVNGRLEQDLSKDLTEYEASDSIIEGANGGLSASSDKLQKCEIISKELPQFDAETLIVHPMMDEELNDEKFYKELGERLIRSLITFHAWAAARPRHEHHAVCELISSKMTKIEESEKEQGRSYSPLYKEPSLPLSSPPFYDELEHDSSEIEHGYPLIDTFPRSPPRLDFVCSRSLEQHRKRLAGFVEGMKNAVAALAENIMTF